MVRGLGGIKPRAEHLFAGRPVAGAQLVGLQRVEDAQRLRRVAADVEAVDGDVLDDVVRIDDERGAEGDMLVAVEDAERLGQLRAIVRDPGEIGIGELLVGAAPGEVDVGGVGRGADQDGVAVREILRELAIAGDLGRADEGEVLRPEEQDLPLAVGLGEVDRLPAGSASTPCWTGRVSSGSVSPTVSMC